jgi:hypothetical protein
MTQGRPKRGQGWEKGREDGQGTWTVDDEILVLIVSQLLFEPIKVVEQVPTKASERTSTPSVKSYTLEILLLPSPSPSPLTKQDGDLELTQSNRLGLHSVQIPSPP